MSEQTVRTNNSVPIRGIEKFNVTFGDIKTNIKEKINDSILSCQVNYSMEMATEITLQIIDRDYRRTTGAVEGSLSFASANYFNIGRDVTYLTKTIASTVFDDTAKLASVDLKTILMEVADVSVAQGQSVSPVWTIKCRPKAVQQMKRDKKPEVVQGNGTAYVQAACKKYGLTCVAEKTTKSKKITKASGENEADSVWDVIQNLATQAKFKCFEADGTLFFGSMKWLMYKWGPDSISYAAQIKNTKFKPPKLETKRVTRRYIPLIPGKLGKAYELQQMPEMNKSDNAVLEASGSAQIDRINGVGVRPGMTVFVGGIPGFTGYYLVSSVSFEERSPNPVGIQFQTPERRPKEKIISLPVGLVVNDSNDAIGPDVIIPFIQRTETGSVDTGTSGNPYLP